MYPGATMDGAPCLTVESEGEVNDQRSLFSKLKEISTMRHGTCRMASHANRHYASCRAPNSIHNRYLLGDVNYGAMHGSTPVLLSPVTSQNNIGVRAFPSTRRRLL